MLLPILRGLWLLTLPVLAVYQSQQEPRDFLTQLLAGDPATATPIIAWALLAAVLFLLPSGPAGPAAAATTHGSAGWATARELRGLLRRRQRPLPPGAFAIAPFGCCRQLVLPAELATHHTLILGSSGTGKTRSLFMPNAALARGSFVATDPKGELWTSTSGRHPVAWRFAPREPEASRCCNWIPLCRDVRLAELLAAATLQTDGASRLADQFWQLAEQHLCAALFAHAAASPIPTPATAYALLRHGPSILIEEFHASPSEAVRTAAAMLEELRPETRAGIVLGVANKLAFLQDPVVQRFTSAETEAIDFAELVRTPIAVYWVLHEQDIALLQSLSSLFFTLLLDQLARAGGTAPVTLLLDEFANLGRLPNFPTTITVARGRGLALVLGLQSLAQLESLYGRSGADTIRTNCATKVILHGLDYASAEEVSRTLGETTVHEELRTRRPEGRLTSSSSYGEHRSARRLLTADEVRRLGQNELLAIVANRRPARLGKHFWRQPPCPAVSAGLEAARCWRPGTPPEDPGHGPRRDGQQ